MNRFQLFEQRHQTALNRIQKYLEPDERYNPPMDGLVQWMLTTDANPYSYLPKTHAVLMNTATGFESLLNQIHHALYDDGDITFVRVCGVPQIAFVDRHDINDERTEILDILPNEFGPIQDQFRREDIHRCFCMDARIHGVDFAITHYRKYDCFNESWIQDVEVVA